jgi:hypothetical protein
MMAQTAAEEYREHQVWNVLDTKLEAVDRMRFQTEGAEEARRRVLEVLKYAQRSRPNVARAALYIGCLDALQERLNHQIPADQGNFERSYIRNGPYAELVAAVRALPGPTPKGMADSSVEALDEAIKFRRRELTDLTSDVAELREEIAAESRRLEEFRKAVEKADVENRDSRARIAQTADDAQSTLRSEWEAKVAEWETGRTRKDEEIDREIDDKLGLLTYASQAAERLVEHAAGRFTARDWAERATRERELGYRMRNWAIIVYILAGLIGAALVLEAIQRDHGLDVSGSLLRIAVVGAIGALGFYLSRESRRHLDEANSSEEVATILQALEFYYASADGETRESARLKVGEMLFVRNIQSRFSARDASRHNALDNQQLNELIDTLMKSAELSRKNSGA